MKIFDLYTYKHLEKDRKRWVLEFFWEIKAEAFKRPRLEDKFEEDNKLVNLKGFFIMSFCYVFSFSVFIDTSMEKLPFFLNLVKP